MIDWEDGQPPSFSFVSAETLTQTTENSCEKRVTNARFFVIIDKICIFGCKSDLWDGAFATIYIGLKSVLKIWRNHNAG